MKNAANLLLTFIIVGGFVCLIWTVADAFGAWDVVKAQQQTRAAEARARELEAQYTLLREKQAMLQTGVLAFASAKDSALVTLTYLAGGVALFLAVIVIGVLLLERGKGHERVY